MEVAGPLGTPLGLAQRKRASPRGEAGTSGFLSVSDSDRRVTAELGQESQESCQASQPRELKKGPGIPRESGLQGQKDFITGLPQDWEKQTPQLWRAQTKFCITAGGRRSQASHWGFSWALA